MASRANQRVLLGCALLCAAALPCADSSRLSAAESQPQPAVAQRISRSPRTPGWPATASRPASSSTSTRPSPSAPSRWPTPIGWWSTFPRSIFSLPAGTGAGGRGLVKAFRYGLVMPGGSRIVFDLTGPGQDRQFLRAGCRQRPAGAAGARTGGGRPHRLRAVARSGEPARTAAGNRRRAAGNGSAAPAAPPKPAAAGRRPSGRRDRSRPWRHRQRHAGRAARARRTWCWPLGWRCATGWKRAANTAS